ncbi:MAG: YihY/virulence factor BrkB family protein [Paludibacter sp.]|jgi:membrane protein|nr:YihY/virulence factor BrkB family protein [Paludibacter sp.]MBP7612266.1 YihY/virulence factor BrkB family protein [Paludibacter sp.]
MLKLIAFIEGIYNFIRFDIWRITEYELTKSRRYFYRVVKTIILATRGFVVDNLNVRASALTYSILFAMIPLFALIIAIAKGFGVDKLIENSLQGTFIGQANLVPTVMGFVQRYLESTQGGLFIGIGIAILFGSVMNFFMQVENAFNSIWQVKKSRSLIHQFTTYFSAILIIPLLIVLSSGFSIYINTILSHSYFFNVLSPVLRFGVKFIPYIINWIVFTIMYMVIPNTRVRFYNAMLAGILAGSAFQLFQMLYINGQVYLSRFNVVYGSFAAIPLLLLWLQISCLIILLGAEISYASQNIKNFDYEVDTKNISSRYKNFLTLFITHMVVKQFEEQKPPLSSEQIAINYKLPIRLVNQILNQLTEVAILIEVYHDSSKSKTYQPAIDINQMTVNLVFAKLEKNGAELFLTSKNELLDSFWQKTLEIKKQSIEQTNHLLVKDI